MKYDFIVSDYVTLVLTPENPMEEELLKTLSRQDNDIVEFRSSMSILNKTVKNGLALTRRGMIRKQEGEPEIPEVNDTEKKDL